MNGLIFATVVFVGFALLLRWIANREDPRFVTITPANTTALVIAKPNTLKTDSDGKVIGVKNNGGRVTNILHATGGRLIKSDHDPMNWYIDETKKERRGLLFLLLDVQEIWLYRYVRINEVRTFRWGRKADEKEYDLKTETQITRFPYYTAQHDIRQEGVETKEIVAFNLRLNVAVREKYPARVRLKFADSYAQMTIRINAYVVNFIGTVDPKQFIGGTTGSIPNENDREEAKKTVKMKLIGHLSSSEIVGEIENETGIAITSVSLPEFDFDLETKKLLEAATQATLTGKAELIKAELEAQARIARADGEMQAQMKANTAAEDRLKKVTIPASETPERAVVFTADRKSVV